MAESSEGSKKISLTVKTAKDKKLIEIEEDAGVNEVSFMSLGIRLLSFWHV